jgi:hypothetical protein
MRPGLKRDAKSDQINLTYAIRHEERMQSNMFESFFSWFLFELPTAYGMEPGRALMFLAAPRWGRL